MNAARRFQPALAELLDDPARADVVVAGGYKPWREHGTVRDRLDELAMFGFARVESGIDLVPISTQAFAALDAPHADRLRQLLVAVGETADELGTSDRLAGITLGRRYEDLALRMMLDEHARGTYAWPTTDARMRDRVLDTRGFLRGAAAVNSGSWIDVTPPVSDLLTDAVSRPGTVTEADRQLAVHVLVHETRHTGSTFGGAQPFRGAHDVEEGLAELLTGWSGQRDRFARRAGLDPVGEPGHTFSPDHDYIARHEQLTGAARLAGLDPLDASDFEPAVALLRRTPLAQLPDTLGGAIAARTGSQELGNGVAALVRGDRWHEHAATADAAIRHAASN